MELFRYRGPRLPSRGARASSEPTTIVKIASSSDPAAYLRWMWSDAGPRGDELGRCMPLGVLTTDTWAYTSPDTHILALGPPRSIAGKTASLMIPTILTAVGPVVSASTKDDIIAATAIARAHKGQLWCYAPDGQTRIPDGVQQLRWSPVVGAEDWGTALLTAGEMTRALTTEDVRGGGHWKERAADLLAPVLHWAALSGRSMKDTRDAVFGILTPVRDTTMGGTIQAWLADHGGQDAASLLGSVLYNAGREELANIASTAARALKGYRMPGAIASTDEPNFDPEAFVRGGVAGRADTIYIISTSRQQEIVAPLVVALLGQIREAAYQVHREQRRGAPSVPSTVFALDEMYGLAPLPDLPAMLTDGGSQGLLVAGAVQDLTLIKSRWPKEADSFLTLFGNVMVFPGIRDGKTLEAVSKLIGDYDREVETWGRGGGQHSTRREPKCPPSKVYAGIDEGNPDVLIFLHQKGWDKLRAMPWWRFDPWPQVLVAYLRRACSGRVPEWLLFEWLETRVKPPDVLDVLPQLPLPDLDRVRERVAAGPSVSRWVGPVPAGAGPPGARAAAAIRP